MFSTCIRCAQSNVGQHSWRPLGLARRHILQRTRVAMPMIVSLSPLQRNRHGVRLQDLLPNQVLRALAAIAIKMHRIPLATMARCNSRCMRKPASARRYLLV